MSGTKLLLDFLMQHAGDGVICATLDGALRVNGAIETMTGHDAAALHRSDDLAAQSARRQLLQAMAALDGRWHGPITCGDGVERPFHLDKLGLEGGAGAAVGLLRPADGAAMPSEVRDALTGLPSRAIFTDRVEQALRLAQRGGGSVAVALLGLDRLSMVNEALGAAAGDRLLVELAERLQRCTRTVDTLARLEGDRFALVTALAAGSDSVIVAEKVMAAVKAPFQIGSHELAMTASLGIGLYPQDAADGDTLVKHAEIALRHAKTAGRNQYQFFSDEFNRRARERLEFEARLRRALAQREFVVYYQPKVRAADGVVVGAEALVRWQDPERGMIPPAHFIGVAEETGMIEELGAWVLAESCRQSRYWQELGLKPVCISVNVSPRQFRNNAFIDTVRTVLAETGLEARWLELEITESMLMRDVEQVVARMTALRQLGVGLSIDDFGTGYSSLSYLGRFPISTLKIDRAFVIDVDSNPKTAEIARAIIGLSRGLNLDVVAEGCELASHVRFLQDNGCDTVQGYYFSKPVPAEQFEQMLRAWRLMPA